MLGDHADPAEAGSASTTTGDRCRLASEPLPLGLSCGSAARPPSPPARWAPVSSLPRPLAARQHWETPRLPLCVPTPSPSPRTSPPAPGSAKRGRKHSGWPRCLLPPLGTHLVVIPETAGPCWRLTHAHAHAHAHTGTCSAVAGTKASGGGCPALSGSLVPSSAPGHPGPSRPVWAGGGPSRCLQAHAATHAWQPGELVAAN